MNIAPPKHTPEENGEPGSGSVQQGLTIEQLANGGAASSPAPAPAASEAPAPFTPPEPSDEETARLVKGMTENANELAAKKSEDPLANASSEQEQGDALEELIRSKTYFLNIGSHGSSLRLAQYGVAVLVVLLVAAGFVAYRLGMGGGSGQQASKPSNVLAQTAGQQADDTLPAGGIPAGDETIQLAITARSSGFLWWKKSSAEVTWQEKGEGDYDFLQLFFDTQGSPGITSPSTKSLPLMNASQPYQYVPQKEDTGNVRFMICGYSKELKNCAVVSNVVEVSL